MVSPENYRFTEVAATVPCLSFDIRFTYSSYDFLLNFEYYLWPVTLKGHWTIINILVPTIKYSYNKSSYKLQ